MEGDERSKKKGKKVSLYFLKIDFSFTLREKANREAGRGLDWRRERIEGGQVVSNTKADERSFFFSSSFDTDTHTLYELHTVHWTDLQFSTKLLKYIVFDTADIPHIDLFHHTVSYMMPFCALVNKYFSYFFCLHFNFPPPLLPVSLPFQSTCVWFTHYMTHSSSPVP